MRFDGKRALSKACHHCTTCAQFKNENPRLQRDNWTLGTYIIDDWWALCGLHPAVELCARDSDSGSSLAAREMPRKGCKRGALQLTNAGQTCNKRPLKIYLLFKDCQHVPFVCAQVSHRNQAISIKLRHRNHTPFFTHFSLYGAFSPHAGLKAFFCLLSRGRVAPGAFIYLARTFRSDSFLVQPLLSHHVKKRSSIAESFSDHLLNRVHILQE